MRNFKKVIAAGLALLMLALSVNVSFAAENYTEKEAIVVAKVNAAGIMTGTDKGFEPSKTLTRAEAAAIIVRMKGISEATVKQNAGTTLFSDVAASHWAAGYVNVASNYNLIKGVGAGLFAPEKEVTVAEFYTMAIRALGAGQLVEAEGTWPTNYVNFAIENDLAEDVAQLYTATSTRLTAATIVANTLTANMWTKGTVKSNGEITWGESDKNILSNVLGIKEYREADIKNISTKDGKAKVTGKAYNYATKALGASDVAVGPTAGVEFNDRANLSTAKEGVKYTVWYDENEKEVLGFWVPKETTAVSFTEIKNIDTVNNKIKLKVDGEETEYDLGTLSHVVLNGLETQSPAWTDLNTANGNNATFGVAYYGTGAEDDKIVSIYAENYKMFGVVKETTDKKITFKSLAGATGVQTGAIYIDSKNNEYLVTKDGKSIDVKDIEEDDVLFYYTVGITNGVKYVINVYNDSLDGKVSAYNSSDKKATIDGTKYDDKTGTVRAGDEGTYYLNNLGKIVMYDKTKGASGDVAMVSAFRTSKATYDNNETIYEFKLSKMDGTLTEWLEFDAAGSVEEKKATAAIDVNATAAIAGTPYTAAEAIDIADGATYYVVPNTMKAYASKATAKAAAIAIMSAIDTEAELGTAISCKISNNKFALKNKLNNDSTPHDLYSAVVGNKFTDTQDFVTIGSVKYYAKNAKVFEIDFDDQDKAYESVKSLKEINIDDLETLTTVAFVTDIDYTDHTFGVMVVTSSNIKGDKKWAYISKVSDYDDNDDKTKEDKVVEVIFEGDTEVTELYADSSKVNNLATGKFIAEIEVDGDVISKAVKVSGFTDGTLSANKVTANEKTRIAKQFSNGTISFNKCALNAEVAATTALADTWALAEDVIVVKRDGSKDSVSSLAAITFLEKGTHFNDQGNTDPSDDTDEISQSDLDNSNEILEVYTWKDNDLNAVEEIIAIVFAK